MTASSQEATEPSYDLESLLSELSQLNSLNDLPRRVKLCRQALKLVQRKQNRQLWAWLHFELGTSLDEMLLGDRADHLEQAVHHYRLALQVYTREAFPAHWAMIQNNLGIVYSDRLHGERADNVEQAIHHYRQALEVYTREADPADWAMTQNNLGEAYRERVRGERADNIEEAILHYEQALQVFTRKAFPVDWAITQNNLANAYAERVRDKRADNLEQAIHYYQKSLRVLTREAFAVDWAMTQNNLANAYAERVRGKRADNLEQAIHHYRKALKGISRQAMPLEWAQTTMNLANAYRERIRGERADNLEQAIYHYQQTLKTRTREASPVDWAMTQNNLGIAYAQRVRGERADNLEQAIYHYQQALKIRTREASPVDWAMTQNNLGIAYAQRVRGERADNLEQAIHHYRLALEVRARKALPVDWAMTQNNLGQVYRARILGDPSHNLEQAIGHYQEALQVFTRETLPVKWATTQNNLGVAYSERIRGKRADNLKQAVYHYLQALQVRTLEALPSEHLQTQQNLGNLYFSEHRWAKAYAAFQAAIDAHRLLLHVTYTEGGRRAEVGATAQLFVHTAYALLRQGQWPEALLALDRGKTRLLSEALASADIDTAALPKRQRKALEKARRTVQTLESEMRLPMHMLAQRDEREVANQLREARANLNQLIEEIRVRHPNFMTSGLELSELLALIPPAGALVAPLVTSQGAAAFIIPDGAVTAAEAHVLWLDDFSNTDLGCLLREIGTSEQGWLDYYDKWRSQAGSLQEWKQTIHDLSGRSWSLLMEHIHERLETFDLADGATILLMPQGGLALLPLHAALREEMKGEKRYFLDDYTVTYAPSGYALSVGRRRLKDAPQREPSLLAVINPTGDLPYSPAEGEAITNLFTSSPITLLREEAATYRNVKEAASAHSYLHFSCHGFYNWQNPMLSAVVLANDEPLTLANIISSLNLTTARLVTMSACETGVTDISQSPDEFLGLPAGILQAGAPGVVSTLWAVLDLSTAMLLAKFYERHLVRGFEPATALREAQLWLRSTTDGEKRAFFRASEQGKTWLLPSAAKTFFQALAFTEDEAHSFEHPFYWAAFTYTGA